MQRLLSTAEAADLAGYTPAHIRYLARTGRLQPAAVSGHGRLFAVADVERVAAERAGRKATREQASRGEG